MKKIISFLTVMILFITANTYSQVVTGKLVDENGIGLSDIFLQLYISPNVYNTTSLSDGSFFFNNINDVEDEGALPSGYNITNNFPNPFNPKTRIGITLPSREHVKVEVFNLLGQSVADVIEQTFDAGTNYIDIELNGLPNGFYISRITIDNKYTVVKKLMLIYGSQHLITDGSSTNFQLNKSGNTFLDTALDSLVATSVIIGRKTFKNLPNFVSGTLDLGNLTIIRYCPGTPTVLYEGKTYHTIQIGNQCWLKENLDVGVMVLGTQEQSDNGVLEKYCYNDSSINCTTYGGLYQWNEAMQYVTTEGSQGICPTVWHIPTLAEFASLRVTVNNDGNALKEIGEGTGTNTSGFSALMAGLRSSSGFFNLEGNVYFWSSTEDGATAAGILYLYYIASVVYANYYGKEYGFSVRCVKD